MAIKGLFSKNSEEELQPKARSYSGKLADQDIATRLKLLENFETSGLGWFWATDSQGQITYLSDSAAEAIGMENDDINAKPITELLTIEGEDNEGRPSRPLPFLMSARNRFTDLPVRIQTNDRVYWWSVSGKPNISDEGEFRGYFGSANDITSKRQDQIDASRMAQYDALTGLANRHRANKLLATTLTAYRSAERSCALMMLDLDRFKQVNDTLGHPAGDELLKQVAQRLQRVVGERGEISRLGGDEFQIMMPDIEDRGDLGALADQIIQMVSQPYSIDGSRAIIGTSVGIAIAPYDGVEPSELVSSVDLALYAAKDGGRGQFRFYSSDLKDGANRRREIEEDLRDAIAGGQLEMYYQPIVRSCDHNVAAFEALMRWKHPERGYISPADFVPIAEDTGLINEMGTWAMKQACKDASAWPGELRVAVNVSAVQFADADLPKLVEEILAETELEPKRLELEITESVFMGDLTSTQKMFVSLKELGVRLALDDFGTGYSSLSYLSNAPFDKIKIDQSFVREATQPGNNNSALIKAIVSLAEALKMETVAEGVEAVDSLELVTKLGASHIQGYIFDKAQPQGGVLARLSDGRLSYKAVGPAKCRSERRTVYRQVTIIHEDHCYGVVMRNISTTGAAVEGMLNVPVGTNVVLDLGAGQLAVSTVRRSQGASQGLEFEQALVRDGTDELCTRHRVSPYSLAAAGMPLAKLPEGNYHALQGLTDQPTTRPAFLQVDITK